VSLYDSSTAYFSGELVYTAPGDGTNIVYRSMLNSNAVDPSLPNQWISTTTYYKNQVVQVFPAWAVGTTYSQGQTVNYTDGNVYSSLTNGNIGHIPPSSPTFWALVPTLILQTQPVPVTQPIVPPQSSPVIEWAVGTVYSAGAFVMFNGVEYLSILGNNFGNYPNAAGSTFWIAVTSGTFYMSLIDFNINNNPASAPALWASGVTYVLNNLVGGPDGFIYKSLTNGNVGNNPLTSPGFWLNTGVLNPWTTAFVGGGGNAMWLLIGGSSFPNGVGLSTMNILYPVGSGPLSQSTTRNVFRLPNDYLRIAPQDPKAGSTSYLGSPTNLEYTDWNFESGFIVSREVNPIVIRFIADVTNVREMDALFCEFLAATIGREVCERLTQSSDKLKTIDAIKSQMEHEAILVDAIETGATEPPLDDYISTRL
jgi:hypothetical protein